MKIQVHLEQAHQIADCTTSTYTPTKTEDGEDLDKVWKDVINPDNWKKCHDAGFVYDWAWKERDENKEKDFLL